MKSFLVLCVVLSLFALSSAAPATDKKEPTTESTPTTAATPATKKKHRETFLEIKYGEEKIVLGNLLKASQMKQKPMVEWKTENDTMYMILMINVDAPSKKHPVDADYAHWLVGNIPNNDIEKGHTLIEYVGAFPEKDVGTQNFMFILYEQPSGRIEFNKDVISDKNGADRKHFEVPKLIETYGLGYALSFNGLKVEYDEYSDVLREQLFPKDSETLEHKTEVSGMMKAKVEEPEMEMRCEMVPKVKDVTMEKKEDKEDKEQDPTTTFESDTKKEDTKRSEVKDMKEIEKPMESKDMKEMEKPTESKDMKEMDKSTISSTSTTTTTTTMKTMEAANDDKKN